MPGTHAIKDRHLKGIACRIGAATCFSAMTALIKLASVRHVSTPEIVFYRNALSLPLLLLWVMAGPGLSSLATRRPIGHLTRAMIGLGSMWLTFQTLALLPLSTAITLTFTSPLFGAMLSPLLLGESVGARRWLAILAGFCGVVLVLRPGPDSLEVSHLGVAIGLCAALAQVGVAITVRQLQSSETVQATVFWLMALCSAFSACMLPFFGHWHGTATFAILLAMSIIGLAGQLLMTASLGAAPVSVVLPFDYLQILGSVLFGQLLFDTLPTASELLGAMVIIGASFATASLAARPSDARGRA